MSSDPCQKHRDEVRDAVREMRPPAAAAAADGAAQGEPPASEVPLSLGRVSRDDLRRGAAKRRYRAAIRTLAECLREHGDAA